MKLAMQESKKSKYILKPVVKLLSLFRRSSQPLTRRDFRDVVEINRIQLEEVHLELAKGGSAGTDINCSDNKKEESDLLTTLPGVGPKTARLLVKAGYRSKNDVLKAKNEELLKIKGIGQAVITRLRKLEAK